MALLTEHDRAKLRYLCDKSFYHFVKTVGGHVRRGGDISSPIYLPTCRLAQDRAVRRKLFLKPRIWRKSTVHTCWRALWEYLQRNEIRILIVHEVSDKAKEFLSFIEAQVENNQMLRWLYPELSAVDSSYTNKHKWNSRQCVLPNKAGSGDPTITAIGIGGAAQGGHYDLILLDDITGERAMKSPLILQRALRWFDNCEDLLINKDWRSYGASEISGVGTHWAPGDWATYVIEMFTNWQVMIVPALKDPELKDRENVKYIQHPRAEPDETNFPEAMDEHGQRAFSTAMYHEMRADPNRKLIFFTQHQNAPGKASELTSFNAEWLCYHHFDRDEQNNQTIVCETDSGKAGEIFKVKDIPLYGRIDPGGFAEKLVKGGSRLAILIGGQPRESVKKFVVYAWADRFKEPGLFIDQVFKAHKEWHPRSWQIDVTGGATYIMGHLKEEAKKRKIEDFHLSPLPIDTSKDSKLEAINSLAEYGEKREIYVLRSMRELIAEWKSYPNTLTMDLLDMMGSLLRCGHWKRRKRTGEASVPWLKEQEPEAKRSAVTGY